MCLHAMCSCHVCVQGNILEDEKAIEVLSSDDTMFVYRVTYWRTRRPSRCCHHPRSCQRRSPSSKRSPTSRRGRLMIRGMATRPSRCTRPFSSSVSQTSPTSSPCTSTPSRGSSTSIYRYNNNTGYLYQTSPTSSPCTSTPSRGSSTSIYRYNNNTGYLYQTSPTSSPCTSTPSRGSSTSISRYDLAYLSPRLTNITNTCQVLHAPDLHSS